MNYIKTVTLKIEAASKEGAGGLLTVLAFTSGNSEDEADYWLLGAALGNERFKIVGWHKCDDFAEVGL